MLINSVSYKDLADDIFDLRSISDECIFDCMHFEGWNLNFLRKVRRQLR